jgi:hypothetical protein
MADCFACEISFASENFIGRQAERHRACVFGLRSGL